jgi:hypothetical protein
MLSGAITVSAVFDEHGIAKEPREQFVVPVLMRRKRCHPQAAVLGNCSRAHAQTSFASESSPHEIFERDVLARTIAIASMR